MEDYKKSNDYSSNDEIYSNAVKAGKRTYFFDIRETRNKDFYLTITESKKRFFDDGSFKYEKHKLFLYKEDFEKFGNALTDAFDQIKNLQENNQTEENSASFTEVDFDSLG